MKPYIARMAALQEQDPVLFRVVAEIVSELDIARRHHGPIHSPHEGHSVIREELDTELWEHVTRDTGRSPQARLEAYQVAAMAIRYVMDLCPPEPDR